VSLLQNIYRTILDNQLIEDQDNIIVAVSGGPDSVTLLHILNKLIAAGSLKCQLTAVHVNHQFRGEESDKEEQFVKDLAQQLMIPFFSCRIDIPKFMEESGMGAQEAARFKRYEYLKATAHKLQASKIALAHHSDDQVETILHRLIRGTGLSGLSGMNMRRSEGTITMIRPFLKVSKTEILAYSDEQQIKFCIDRSNLEKKYMRNKIRLDAVPLLERMQPEFKDSILRLADIIQYEDDYIHQQCESWFRAQIKPIKSGISFSVSQWLGLHIALQRRVIKLILSYLFEHQAELDFTRIELIRKALLNKRTTMKLDVGGDIVFIKEYDHAKIVHRLKSCIDLDQTTYLYQFEQWDKIMEVPEANMQFTFRHDQKETGSETAEPKNEAVFDAEKLVWPLAVRNRRDGDRIELLGLKGSKKVKDIFIDEKIAPSLRTQQPILVDAEDRLLWIPGLRRSRHALVEERTTRVMHMSWETMV
jgi:tRNA(Ile)-lysidine synthase